MPENIRVFFSDPQPCQPVIDKAELCRSRGSLELDTEHEAETNENYKSGTQANICIKAEHYI